MEAKVKIVEEYINSKGKIPFRVWLKSLKDKKTQAIVDARITRIRRGNFGNCRSVGHGVNELKIDYGSGYRVYFAQEGDTVVILLCGGDKGTQDKDILIAHEYWADYKKG